LTGYHHTPPGLGKIYRTCKEPVIKLKIDNVWLAAKQIKNRFSINLSFCAMSTVSLDIPGGQVFSHRAEGSQFKNTEMRNIDKSLHKNNILKIYLFLELQVNLSSMTYVFLPFRII
jgi:hypothetical protein